MQSRCLGIEINDDRVAFAYVKRTFGKIRLGAYAAYSYEKQKTIKEKLDLVLTLYAEFKKEHNASGSEVFLGIPRNLAIFKEIEFPLAVKENLKSTLRYELEKHVPLSAGDVYFDCQVVSESKADNRMRVLLVVVKKTDLSPYIDFIGKLPEGAQGIEIVPAAQANAAAFIQEDIRDNQQILQLMYAKNFPDMNYAAHGLAGPDALGAFGLALQGVEAVLCRINLLPDELRKKPGRGGYYALIVFSVFLLLSAAAWSGSYLVKQKILIKELDTEIRRHASEIKQMDVMKRKVEAIEKKLSYLSEFRQNAPAILDILKELSQIVPETAWIDDLSYSEKGIQINGYADAASDLIPILEDSPLFKNVHFTSTIVKDRDGKKERFRIGFDPEFPGEIAYE